MRLTSTIYVILLSLCLISCKSESGSDTEAIPSPNVLPTHLEFDIGTSYSFGSRNVASVTKALLKISNNTASPASNFTADTLAAPYTFVGGSFPGLNGTCTGIIYSGSDCYIHIEFTPSSLGIFSDDLIINYDLINEPTTSKLKLIGYGALVGELQISEAPTYNYGNVASGASSDYSFIVTNVGVQNVTGISFSIASSPFRFKDGTYPGTGGNCSDNLPALATCSVVLSFAPAIDGIYSEDLEFSYFNSQNPDMGSITLTGIATNVTAADMVSDLSVTNTGLTSADLSWTAPADNGSAISDYSIEYKASASGTWLSFTDGVSITTNATVTGLSPSTSYDFRVKAFNGAYASDSNTATDTTKSPPDAINNLTITNASPFQLSISWTAPVDNGTAITDYNIEYKESAAGVWLVFADGVSTDLSSTVTGLSEETSYDFRVRAFNGAYSLYSNVATGETTIDDPFFDPTVYKAMNLGGATASAVVAMDDATTIELNGNPLTTINAGETFGFVSAQNDIISADKPIFVAGRRGSGSDTQKGNMVWNTPDWAGKTFAFTGSRDPDHKITIYAFEDTDITIKQGATTVASQSITTGNNHTFSLSTLGSFTMTSTGLIVAYMYSSNNNTGISDPKPLLPAATDIIGFPSSSLKMGSILDANTYNGYHSNSVTISGTANAGTEETISPEGTSSLYQGESLRIIASTEVVGNSHADSNGNCSAPFVPVTMMKKRFAINVNAEFVAFASIEPGTITVTTPAGSTSTLTLVKTGVEPNAPYKARLGTTTAGHRFESNIKFQAWYEPSTDTNASDNDETVMFGAD